jgi:drug/metabolite transporter (DMT)-like permease
MEKSMTPRLALILSLGSFFAAAGQLFLKFGAQRAASLSVSLFSVEPWLNAQLFLGFLLYGLGAVVWVYGLARAPLYMVYPFAMLTFVFVGILGIVVLGERPGWTVLFGWAVIASGIAIISVGAARSGYS